MKTKSSIIEYVFAIIGLTLLGGALYLYQDKQAFLKKAEVTQGTVIELLRTKSDNSITYFPVVEFTTKAGKKISFSSSDSSNPPSYNEGENVEVLYNPINPNNAAIKGFKSLYLGVLIIGIVGTAFFILGFISIRFGYLKQKKLQYLLENGQRISTKFENVQLNSSSKENVRNSFLIYSQWLNPNTNELYVFKSDTIWFDPTDFIKTKEIMVVIDPRDPRKYFMDTSFLPNLEN